MTYKGAPNGGTHEDQDYYYSLRDFGELEARSEAGDEPAFRRIINPADWEGVPVPEREWCVPGYIPHAAVTLLSGDGGLGKSLLILQLAAARALARDWIGLQPTPGRTLVLSCEDDEKEMHRRLDDIRKFYGATWLQLGDIRLADLSEDDSILGLLTQGQIKPTRMYHALDAGRQLSARDAQDFFLRNSCQ